ncbi:DoxX family membrane protein [Nigerium massiliense]|uniref:DoxX family membrane protein n=1 Tax=Nigerium massiliense TaxID=1522317 RepID=UPI00058C8C1C|nr:DoxX family membrane protein [Nigerium massiliense]
MNLLRGVGRVMLASFFISNGVKAIRKPDEFVSAAEPLAEKFVPFAQKALPESVSAYIPEDAKTLVRVDGALSVLGGLGMATNVSSRGGAGLAALSMLPHLVASNPTGAGDKKAARSIFIRNLALTGAALVVSQDTKGNPSIRWRATDLGARLGRSARKRGEEISRDANKLNKQLSRDAGKLNKKAHRKAEKAGKQLQSTFK